MSYSISFLIQGEPITLTFNAARTAIEVMRVLEQNFEVTPAYDEIEYIRHIRAISGFCLSQPLFVDLMSNAVDFRLGTPKSALCRTNTTADLISITELQYLQKREVKGSFAAPIASAAHTVQQMQTITSLAPPPLFPQVYQFAPYKQPQFIDSDQLIKPIYTLVVLCAKNHQFIAQAMEYTGYFLQQTDSDSVRLLGNAYATRILSLTLQEQIQKIQQIPFPGELREKVIQIMQKQLAQYAPVKLAYPKAAPQQSPITSQGFKLSTAVPAQMPQMPQKQQKSLKQAQPPDISQDEKLKQVYTVLKQLPAEAVSKLVHSTNPELPLFKMKQVFNDLQFNNVKFKEDQRKSGVQSFAGILTRILLAYNNQIAEYKARHTMPNYPLMREKVLNLYEKYAYRHQDLVRGSESAVFHRTFSTDENILILLKTNQQLRPTIQLYSVSYLLTEVHTRHLLFIFDKLKNIVDQHKPQQTRQRESIQPPVMAKAKAETVVIPTAPPPVIQLSQPIYLLAPPALPFSTPPPVFYYPPPAMNYLAAQQPTQQTTQYSTQQPAPEATSASAKPKEAREEQWRMSQQQQQIYEDVYKQQERLVAPYQQKIQELAASCKPIAAAKIFVTILGLGYQYYHLYILEQNLLHKYAEMLISQLKIDIQPQDFKNIIDQMLLCLICYIIKAKNEDRLQYTQKQKPQLIRIPPYTQSPYDVTQFFSVYQYTCDTLRAELQRGVNIQAKTQFYIFSKAELLEMFQDVNIFGDYLEMISCSQQ